MHKNNNLLFAAILLAPATALILWLLHGAPTKLPDIPALRTLMLVIVLIPICEEIVFRGLLQSELISYAILNQGYWGITWDNLICGALFTAVHTLYFTHPAALLILIPALILGYFYHQKRRLIYPIILHAWYNANGLLIYTFMD